MNEWMNEENKPKTCFINNNKVSKRSQVNNYFNSNILRNKLK